MRIIGSETRRNENSTFSLFIVDNLDSIYTITVKSGFWKNIDAYKKHIFTNGTVEKTFSKKENNYFTVRFKVNDGDWLIIMNDDNKLSMYISEQYCGPIKVKNKEVQRAIDGYYEYCRERIDSKHRFAKEMGAISRRLNLPFQIVLAFKGNEELLGQMVQNIENAINNRFYEDDAFMQALSSADNRKREKAIETFGIMDIPSYQSERIASYLTECLASRKVVRRYE